MIKEYIERSGFLSELKEHHDNVMQDPEIDSATKYLEAVCYNKTKEELEKAVPVADVTTLPCKPGDKIYRIVHIGKRLSDIRERIVSSVEYNAAGEWVIHSTGEDVLGKTCFLTYAEAKNALYESNKS